MDDLGNEYRFQPPETNPDLTLEPGETLKARLAFLGRMVERPESLTLQLNYAILLDKPVNASNPYTDAPSFTFEDLPLPH